MEAYRRIVKTESDQLCLTLPESLTKQKLEVTIRLVDEANKRDWPDGFIERFWGCLPDFPDIVPEGPLEKVGESYISLIFDQM